MTHLHGVETSVANGSGSSSSSSSSSKDKVVCVLVHILGRWPTCGCLPINFAVNFHNMNKEKNGF